MTAETSTRRLGSEYTRRDVANPLGADDITFPWSRGVIADVAGDENAPT